MKVARFVNGEDKTSFMPFIMEEVAFVSDPEGADYRLVFGDWEWLHEHLGSDTINGYYLNGTGLEGLIKAARLEAHLSLSEDRIEYNSEGDTCYLKFSNLHDACVTAELAQNILLDQNRLQVAIVRAQAEEFE